MNTKWKFSKIFLDFKLQLPFLTTALMATSKWFVNNWFVIPLVPVLFWLTSKLIRLSKSGDYALDMIKLCLPISGSIIEKSVVARTMVCTLDVTSAACRPLPHTSATTVARRPPGSST